MADRGSSAQGIRRSTLRCTPPCAIEPLLARASPRNRPKPDGIILPDGRGVLHPAAKLKRGVFLPAGLLDVDPPPVPHPILKDHKVFKFEGWKRETFGLGDLLRTGEIAKLSMAGRRRFFRLARTEPRRRGA